jgi:hypothetical protein
LRSVAEARESLRERRGADHLVRVDIVRDLPVAKD